MGSPEKAAAGALTMRSVVSGSLASSFDCEEARDALSTRFDDQLDNIAVSTVPKNREMTPQSYSYDAVNSSYGTFTYEERARFSSSEGSEETDNNWRSADSAAYARYYHTSRGRRAAYAFVTVQTCLALLLIVYDAWYSGYPPYALWLEILEGFVDISLFLEVLVQCFILQGPIRFFKSRWNVADVLIALLCVATFVLYEHILRHPGADSPIARYAAWLPSLLYCAQHRPTLAAGCHAPVALPR